MSYNYYEIAFLLLYAGFVNPLCTYAADMALSVLYQERIRYASRPTKNADRYTFPMSGWSTYRQVSQFMLSLVLRYVFRVLTVAVAVHAGFAYS